MFGGALIYTNLVSPSKHHNAHIDGVETHGLFLVGGDVANGIEYAPHIAEDYGEEKSGG